MLYKKMQKKNPITNGLVSLKDTLKVFNVLKNKQKLCKVIFLICKSMYIVKVYSILYTMR